MHKSKNSLICLLMILAGIVLGGFIGQLAAGIGPLSFLNYGQTFGMDAPLVLNLGIVVLTFGISIHISVAGMIGIIVGIIIYRSL